MPPRLPDNLKPASRLVHSGQERSPYGETSEALYLTSGYVYDSAAAAARRFAGEEEGFIYSRYSNPTVRMFENRMAALEDAEGARATASGMAAVTLSLLASLRQGDHVVAARALFGSCHYVITEILPRYGIEVSLVDGREPEHWQQQCRDNTKVFFLETPSNPRLEIIAIAAIAEIAHQAGALLIVDNVFATPVLQHPLALGADIVVYSATKHIDGQGRALAGVVLGSNDFLNEKVEPFLRNTGPALSPFNAWIMLKGLETLPVRVAAHCANAHKMALFLQQQKTIKKVLYPGLPSHPQHNLAMGQMDSGGPLLAFEVEGGREEAFRFADALQLIGISNNLGDAKSLIIHPATTTHYRVGEKARADMQIGGNLLRLSAGLEDADDLIADLERGLAAMRAATRKG